MDSTGTLTSGVHEPDKKIHVNIRVYGKVQETGYRFSAMQAAYRYGVFGNVQYMTDGSIYIEAEGYLQNLNNFLAWCQHGPTWSTVSKVLVEENSVHSYTSFDIIRNNSNRQIEIDQHSLSAGGTFAIPA